MAPLQIRMMKLLAIAINTVRHGMRMKLVIAFVFFLVAVLVLVPFTLKSATQTGKVQTTLTYSLSVLNIILSLLTIFLSTSTFCGDIRNKTIFTIDTKPVRRWEILAGKWVGVMVLSMVLLICAGGAIYGLLKYIARPLEGQDQEQSKIREEVLTARVEARAEPVEGGESTYVVRPQRQQRWQFHGLKPSEELISIKFRNFSSGGTDVEISGVWIVGDVERSFYQEITTFTSGSFHEFHAPASVISSEGELDVTFTNFSPNQATAIFPHDDVRVLYRAGGFGGNLFRGMLLILLRVAFISAVALASSTFLTFPVATLLSIFVLVMSLSVPFIQALLGQSLPFPEAGLTSSQAELTRVFARRILSSGLKVFPDLRAYDPVPYAVNGLLIGWGLVLKGFAAIVLLRCGLIGLFAHIVFNRRELANMGYS